MDSSRIPTFDGNNDIFDSYAREVRLWTMSTTLRTEQRGPALLLRLTGRAKAVSENMDLDEVNQDAGVDYVLDFLRTNPVLSHFHHAFDIFRKLIRLRRTSNTESLSPEKSDVELYINKFFSYAQKLHTLGVPMNEALMTLLVIENADLSPTQRELVDTLMLTDEQRQFSYDRAAMALRQILKSSATTRTRSDVLYSDTPGMTASRDDDELTEVECDPEEMQDSFPFEIMYVQKNGRFFKRFKRRYKGDYYQKKFQQFRGSYGKSKGKGKGSEKGYSQFPSSFPNSPHWQKGGKKGGKGSGKQSVFATDSKTPGSEQYAKNAPKTCSKARSLFLIQRRLLVIGIPVLVLLTLMIGPITVGTSTTTIVNMNTRILVWTICIVSRETMSNQLVYPWIA